MNTFDGGPAFPGWTYNDTDINASDEFGTVLAPGGERVYAGMALRDFFAAKAIPLAWATWEVRRDKDSDIAVDDVARLSYRIADAMLAARSK